MIRKDKQDISLLERAERVGIERKFKKILPIIMSCIIVLTSLVYVVSVMYSKFGDFTISVNRFNYVEKGLSLSETKKFEAPTSSLNCRASEIITNIDGKSLDNYDLGAIDGNDSGENYLCYTFYCKNSGTENVAFGYSIKILEMTMDIEKAVRIRLITKVNEGENVSRDYARISSMQDENGNFLPEEGTVPFLTKETVMSDEEQDFKPNDVMKCTVVIWLEGPDSDCVDGIIGGEFKITMQFNIIG